MDLTQIIIVISLVAVTGVIVGCGIWLMMILKEVKKTVIKANDILDDTKSITSSIARPVSSISEFIMGFKNGMNLFNTFFHKKKKVDEDSEE